MIKVTHKAGKKYPPFKVILYCFLKLLFRKEVKVVMTIDQGILGARTGGTTYLKVCGWKSGVNTETNSENLIAFRVLPELDVFESCEYYRRKEKIEFTNSYSFVPVRVKTIAYTLKRGKGQWIPAFSWNGGSGVSSKGDFSYLLDIR